MQEKKYHYGLLTFLIALIVAACIFLPYIISDNGYWLYMGDYNAQSFVFYKTCHEAIRSGKLTIDWLSDLGNNFVGTYAYYTLGSPFFWLTLLFPTSWVGYLMGPIFMLKFALAALFAYIYIKRYIQDKKWAVFGALLYAFSCWSLWNIFFFQFHEALIFFPLLLWAIDKTIIENSRCILPAVVCICAVSNYYMFFGMAVFAILYVAVRTVCVWLQKKRFAKTKAGDSDVVCSDNTDGWSNITVGRFVAIVVECIIGVLVACIILLPAAYTVLYGNRSVTPDRIAWQNWLIFKPWETYIQILFGIFNIADIPGVALLNPNCYAWSACSLFLPGIGITGILAWIFHDKKHWISVLCYICIPFMFIPALNAIFCLFTAMHYMRWYYMFILILCLGTAMAFDKHEKESEEINLKKTYWINLIGTAVSWLLLLLLPCKNEETSQIEIGLYNKDFKIMLFIVALLSALSLFVSACVIFSKKPKALFKQAVAGVLLCSMFVSVIYIGLPKSGFSESNFQNRVVQNQVNLNDFESNFRTHSILNDYNAAAYWGYPSIDSFVSSSFASSYILYDFCKVGDRGNKNVPPSDYSFATLLSTKYVFVDNNTGYKYAAHDYGSSAFDTEETTAQCIEDYGPAMMPGYSYYATFGDIDVYKNDNFIPVGFTYENYILYDEAKEFIASDDVSPNDIGMMMLDAVLLNEEQAEKYKTSFSRIAPSNVGTTYDDYVRYCNNRKKSNVVDFSFDKNGFSAFTMLSRDDLVVFSVPYDKGWTAYINGKEAEIEEVNAGMMAVYCSAGDNNIVFVYETPWLQTGKTLMTIGLICYGAEILGVGLILLYGIWQDQKNLNKKKKRVA